MMDEDLYTLLSPLCANRVYPSGARENTAVPYIVYLRVATTPQNVLDKLGGDPVASRALVQIDAYDTTYASVRSIIDAVCAAMLTFAYGNLRQNVMYWFETDTHYHRGMVEYAIWF